MFVKGNCLFVALFNKASCRSCSAFRAAASDWEKCGRRFRFGLDVGMDRQLLHGSRN